MSATKNIRAPGPKRVRTLTSPLESQLIVRNYDEVVKTVRNAENLMTLLSLRLNMRTEVNAFFDRLNSVAIIRYDIDELGNPLLSKREKALLNDVIRLESKKNRC